MPISQAEAQRFFEQLLAATDALQPSISTRLSGTFVEARAAVDHEALERAIRDRDDAGAMAALGLSALALLIRRVYLELYRRTLAATDELITEQIARVIGRKVETAALSGAALRWSGPVSAGLAASVIATQSQALREAIVRALDQGRRLADSARTVGSYLGLERRQMLSLERYELEDIAAAIREGRITARKGRALVEEYRQALLLFRVESLSRTGLTEARNGLQLRIMREAANRRLFPPAQYEKQWMGILGDGRICQVCYGLHGQQRPIDRPFQSSSGEFMFPPAHIRCRCGHLLVSVEQPQAKLLPFVEPEVGRGLRPMIPAA